MKILICFGTRPEVIKLALLSQKLSKEFEVTNVFTQQHHSLYNDVKHLIPNVDYTFSTSEYDNLNSLYGALIKHSGKCFRLYNPDLVIVQGDTATAYCAAFSASMMGIKVGHVEAGLRTYDLKSPFPEEFNRQEIGRMAYYHWCPSQMAVENLTKEGVKGKIILTGNTIVDFLYNRFDIRNVTSSNNIVITLHRRENANLFKDMLRQINNIAKKNGDLKFTFPCHPNPIIRKQLEVLDASNIFVEKPMKYEDFIGLLMSCRGIITDSGGIQEEAVCLKKKALVCRNTTERQEAVSVGISKLVGVDIESNFEWLLSDFSKDFQNPYGDGNACEKIVESISKGA